jgi:uncharacterized membrane protein YoaK (UPF0700 family)
VFTTIAGRFRSTLTGTIMRLVVRLGEDEQMTVLLDQPTFDGFVLLQLAASEVVALDGEPRK